MMMTSGVVADLNQMAKQLTGQTWVLDSQVHMGDRYFYTLASGVAGDPIKAVGNVSAARRACAYLVGVIDFDGISGAPAEMIKLFDAVAKELYTVRRGAVHHQSVIADAARQGGDDARERKTKGEND